MYIKSKRTIFNRYFPNVFMKITSFQKLLCPGSFSSYCYVRTQTNLESVYLSPKQFKKATLHVSGQTFGCFKRLFQTVLHVVDCFEAKFCFLIVFPVETN